MKNKILNSIIIFLAALITGYAIHFDLLISVWSEREFPEDFMQHFIVCIVIYLLGMAALILRNIEHLPQNHLETNYPFVQPTEQTHPVVFTKKKKRNSIVQKVRPPAPEIFYIRRFSRYFKLFEDMRFPSRRKSSSPTQN